MATIPKETATVSRYNNTDFCVVDSGSIHLGTTRKRVEWLNETADYIEVLVPAENAGGNIKYLIIAPGETEGITFHPKRRGSSVDTYPYAVYCHETETFAYGGSEPEMIVP